MKRSRVAVLFIIGMLITRAADCATTFYFTPDLSHEGNPLVKVLGAGWMEIVLLNVVATAGIIACATYWWRHPLRVEAASRLTDAWTFASWAYFGTDLDRRSLVLKMLLGARPRQWSHLLQIAGFVAPIAGSVVGTWAVVSWLAIWQLHWIAFIDFFRICYPVSACWPVALTPLFVVWFYQYEFRQHRAGQHEA